MEREDHLRASWLRCALSHGTVVSVQRVPAMTREATLFPCLQVGYFLLQAPACLVKKYTWSSDFLFAWILGIAKRDCEQYEARGKEEENNWRHPDTKQTDLCERSMTEERIYLPI